MALFRGISKLSQAVAVLGPQDSIFKWTLFPCCLVVDVGCLRHFCTSQ